MEADFCVATLEETLARHRKLDIFNTDQGSQFASVISTYVLPDNEIRIFMNSRGRWLGSVFIENSISIGHRRTHRSLNGRSPAPLRGFTSPQRGELALISPPSGLSAMKTAKVEPQDSTPTFTWV